MSYAETRAQIMKERGRKGYRRPRWEFNTDMVDGVMNIDGNILVHYRDMPSGMWEMPITRDTTS